ncbi:MAG: beta-galactosidase [Eubacterium sp.]|nr:beta-galactosidase [Eubacterium sp.]
MKRSMNLDHLTLGVCYYPEHWSENQWRDDLKKMKEYGIEVIRIAEFAWNKFEPEEGVYTFEFFDRFIQVATEEAMRIIMCTPTATPPMWLTEKYKEVLNADLDGNLIYPGTRRHYNLNSKVYQDFSRKITEKLAEHYVKHPQIIGWQLDNEINCEMDLYYSQSDHEAFRAYMKEKYGTLERLNEAMGTIFWNQTYTDWEQVHLTRRTNTYGHMNPHVQLEEKRFISDSVIQFFKIQSDIIRKWQKRWGRDDQFITTNGLFRHIDYQKLVDQCFDFITFDNYPAFAYENILTPEQTNGMKDRNSSQALIRTRSISPIFGIMEQQSGAGGWNSCMMMPMPKPGQMRLWALQAIAHGADFISFFRWRTATMGTEIYWHGLHDYDNRENRRVRELKQLSADVRKLSEYVVGTKYQAKVAILSDYANEWDGEQDIWHGPLHEKSMDSWFVTLQRAHVPYDLVYMEKGMTEEQLASYEVLIYPHGTIFTEEQKDLLEQAMKRGAKVIFGCRSGYKNEVGQCYTMPMPGYVSELTGCVVEEYTYISNFDDRIDVAWNGKRGEAILFHDILEPTDGEAVATFESDGDCHYAGKPAIVSKNIGTGVGYYVGAAFSRELAELVMELVGMRQYALLDDVMQVPECVEVAVRGTEQQKVVFLLNYENKKSTVSLKKKMRDVLSCQMLKGDVEIEGRDCLILTF